MSKYEEMSKLADEAAKEFANYCPLDLEEKLPKESLEKLMDEVLDVVCTSDPNNFARIREALSTAYAAGEKHREKLMKREYLRGFIDGGAGGEDYTMASLEKDYKRYLKDNPEALTTKHE